jgi:hypothetical protein
MMKETISSTRSIKSSFSIAPEGRGQLFARMMARRVDVERVETSIPSSAILCKSVTLDVGGGEAGGE